MRIPARATLGVASFASILAATCSGSTESAISVSGVTPDSAYNNNKVDLVITGGPFRPAYDIDTVEGRAVRQLGAFTAYLSPSSGGGQRVAVDGLTWLSNSALGASLRAELPAGVYDVEVLDPRGAIAELPEGFRSLGPDDVAPDVKIREPKDGTIVNPSAEVPVSILAGDMGTVTAMTWTVTSPGIAPLTGTCPPGTPSPALTCQTVFVVPASLQSGQLLVFNVVATDAAGNVGRQHATLVVGLPPVVTGFAPQEGPAQGLTEFSIQGENFITGTQVLLGGVPIDPGGGRLVDDKHIVGTTPAHDAGRFSVVVRTGGASVTARDTFLFVGAPVVLAVSPTSGPPQGGTPVVVVGRAFREDTMIRFGPDTFDTALPLLCPTMVSPNRIEGFMPPGVGVVSIFAFDPVSPTSERPLAFTYLSEDSPDASFAAPPLPCQDGGIP